MELSFFSLFVFFILENYTYKTVKSIANWNAQKIRNAGIKVACIPLIQPPGV